MACRPCRRNARCGGRVRCRGRSGRARPAPRRAGPGRRGARSRPGCAAAVAPVSASAAPSSASTSSGVSPTVAEWSRSTRGRSAPATGLAAHRAQLDQEVVPTGQRGEPARDGRRGQRPAAAGVDGGLQRPGVLVDVQERGPQRVQVVAGAPGEPAGDVAPVRVAGVLGQPPVAQPRLGDLDRPARQRRWRGRAGQHRSVGEHHVKKVLSFGWDRRAGAPIPPVTMSDQALISSAAVAVGGDGHPAGLGTLGDGDAQRQHPVARSRPPACRCPGCRRGTAAG